MKAKEEATFSEPAKPWPVIDEDSRAFWDHLTGGQFVAQRCSECMTIRFPVRSHCRVCLALDHEWEPVVGRGRVYSYVIYERAFHKGYSADIPYALALVEFDEQLRIPGCLIDIDLSRIEIGMAVELFVEDRGDGLCVPIFRPV